MKILVCGDREWTDAAKIEERFKWFEPASAGCRNTILHGDCRGADRLAAQVLKKMGLKVKAYPADWKKHGNSAGPIRNRQMLDLEPDLVIAFHSNIKKSKGTKDCIEEANRRGIRVEIIP